MRISKASSKMREGKYAVIFKKQIVDLKVLIIFTSWMDYHSVSGQLMMCIVDLKVLIIFIWKKEGEEIDYSKYGPLQVDETMNDDEMKNNQCDNSDINQVDLKVLIIFMKMLKNQNQSIMMRLFQWIIITKNL